MGRYTAAVVDRLVLPACAMLSRGQEQRLRLLGGIIPAAIPIQLLIDTGSGRSTLVPWVIAQLDPVSQAAVRLVTGTGTAETMLFWVRLEFPGTALAPIPELAVARIPLPPSLHSFQGLLGRDLLSRWDFFLYEGQRRRFTIRDTPGGLFSWSRR